jgi:hypothetical protein
VGAAVPSRRRFLLGAAALAAASSSALRRARGEPVDGQLGHPIESPAALRFQTMSFERTPMYGGPSTAIAGIPKDLAPGERLPLVILLPGGHHNMQGHVTGVWGWWCEYMLGDTDAALRRGRLGPRDFMGYVRPNELDAYNAWLSSMPFRGLIYLTPWVVGRQLDPAPHGLMVAEFLRELVARARAELPVLPTREATGVGGMSSGGLHAIYAGSVCSDLFSTIIATQPFTEELVRPLHRIVLARQRPQALRLVSSVDDHQKKSTVELSEALRADGIAHEYGEYPGAHSAAFAAGPGGIDALLHFDRSLRGESIDGTRPLPGHDGLEMDLAVRGDPPRVPLVDPQGGASSSARASALVWSAAAAGAVAIGVGLARASREDRAETPAPCAPSSSVETIEVAIDTTDLLPEPAAPPLSLLFDVPIDVPIDVDPEAAAARREATED